MTTLLALSLWVYGGEQTVSSFIGSAGAMQAPLVIGPGLIWAALRFGPRAAFTALAVTSVLCVREAVSGNGPFVRETGDASQNVIAVQAFLAVMLSTILILQAMMQALRLTLAETRRNRSRLDQLASRIKAVMWMLDPKKHDFLYVSPAFGRVLGRPVGNLDEDPLDWLESVHPRGSRAGAAVHGGAHDADGTTRPVDLTFRILRGDGEVTARCVGSGRAASPCRRLRRSRR